MLEEWVWDYDTISQFAKNAAGEPIPRALLERMVAARDFAHGTRKQLSCACRAYATDRRAWTSRHLPMNHRQYTLFAPLEMVI
jgi:thimet oligopeptidase